MFKNYFKVAFRNLAKNRFFTLLNLLGLALGISVSLALILFVSDELSFDKYHTHAENIHRVGVIAEYDDTREKWATAPNIAGPTFKDQMPEVVEQVRFLRHGFGETAFLRVGEDNFLEPDLYWVDSTLFDVFDISLIQGDPQKALNEPNEVILSQSAAKTMFGEADPMGKSLFVDNDLELQITGIYEDFPPNSTLDAKVMGSFYSMKWATERLVWSNCSFETFLRLHPETDASDLDAKTNAILQESVKEEDRWFSMWTQPLLDVHLHSVGINDVGYSSSLGDIAQVRILGVLALSILLLACFNYINMTTARSRQRFREVGINKTLGASSGQMAIRFFLETGILVAASFIAGLLLLRMGTPYFESLTGRPLMYSKLASLPWMGALIGLWGLITFGAGLYPALMLSSFAPKNLLQPANKGFTGRQFFRHALVALQFVVCMALIVGALVFNRQLQYISKKKLGFEPEQVVAINTFAAEETSQIEGLMRTYESRPDVLSLCRAQGYPGIGVSGYSMTKPGQDNIVTEVNSNHVTPGFETVLGLKFLAGTTLPEKQPEDTTVQVVMNKTGVEFLGWTPEEAIGKSPPNMYRDPTTIVGVVEDFHFESLHNPIKTYVFNNGNNFGWTPYLLVKLQAADLQATVAGLEDSFNGHLPKSAFELVFVDDHTARLYESEQRLSRIVWIFTILAIIISCLGLFGLAAFTAERRTKEIGIRKVLGASTEGLVGLLAKEFLRPVIIAVLIASPLAWMGMRTWLDNFAYRIDLNWMFFLIAGLLATLIAFLTVSFQSFRAARANPADSLRNE
ncbi:MAG: FtsX-like permease family protein [Bacteroidetes bacterium]|nr:FtsX-like permease family protein [Bacteroidota bacterium]